VIRGRLTDDEWGFFEPFVRERGPLRGRPPRDHRRTLDAIFWIARTGAPWRDLPEELGNWNSVHRQFRRWTASGLWDLMLAALAEGGGRDVLQMIDSTIVRAHTVQRAEKGDSEPGSWPFARRLLDRNPPSKLVTVATSGDYGRTRPALVM
jgi:transposase